MNGRNGTTTFLPLDSRIGGQGRNNHPTVGTIPKIESKQDTYTER